MKLKLTVSIACLFMLSLQLIAQRTVTNKDYRGRIVEQYQVNANGDYHGTYTKYFSNGVIQEVATYNRGKITSRKSYEYIGKIRYLMGDRTWDSKGELLTSKIRTHDPYTNKVSEVIETAGLLRNGRWRGWPGHETYAEIYNGNDTIYEWHSRDKSDFIGKYLNGTRIQTIGESQLLSELAIRDSIRYDNYLEYETEYYKKKDDLQMMSNTYYHEFIRQFDDESEQIFYEFLCKYLELGKDEQFKAMIIDALDLQYITDIPSLNLYCTTYNTYNAKIQASVANTTYTILGTCYYNGDRLNVNSMQYDYGCTTPYVQSKLLKVIAYMDKNLDKILSEEQ